MMMIIYWINKTLLHQFYCLNRNLTNYIHTDHRFWIIHSNKNSAINNCFNKSLLFFCHVIFAVHHLNLLHDGADKLLGVLPGGEVQGVIVVEGGVAGDEHEAGAEDPEHEASGSSE